MNSNKFFYFLNLFLSVFSSVSIASAADLHINEPLTSQFYQTDGSIVAQSGCELEAPHWAWFVASNSVRLEPGFRVGSGGEFGIVIGDGYQDLPRDLDYNGNGLPDWWELHYLADPNADPDGDGVINSLEHRFGTDPMDSSSKPVGIHYEYDAFGRIKEILRFPTPE